MEGPDREKRQNGAFLADHPADECVDADEQRELREVLAQPQADGLRVLASGDRHSRVRPVALAQSSGPPASTATSARPRATRIEAAVMARSPCPHIIVTGPGGTSSTASGTRPSSM